MIPIIVTGHGKFASSLKSTMEYIMGEQKNIHFIDFDNGMGDLELSKRIKEILDKYEGDEVIFLTDIMGGTPFSTAVMISENLPNYRVYSGCNMPMLIAALDLAEDGTIDEIEGDILEFARDGIMMFEKDDVQIRVIGNENVGI